MAGIFSGGDASVKPVVYTALQVQTSSQGLAVPVFYGTGRVTDNLIWYNGFTATQASSGGKGGALANIVGKNTGQYAYSANVILGVAEGPIQGFGQAWASKTPTSLAALGFTTFLGTYPQTPWAYVSTNVPADARPYSGLAYLAAASYALGTSAELPNHTFEVYGIFSNRVVYTDASIPGSNPRTITVGSRTWADGTVHSMWVSDVGVAGFTAVGGAPAPGQYSVSAGVYTFNAADGGTAVEIAWNGQGQDADPSLILADMLSNANYGSGFAAAMIGDLTAYTENIVISGSNLVLQSEAFGTAPWTRFLTTVSANVITAPDGTLSGDKLIATVSGSSQHQSFSNNVAVLAGQPVTGSVYFHAAEYDEIALVWGPTVFGTFVVGSYDISAMSASVSGGTSSSAHITGPDAFGFYRVDMTAIATASGNATLGVYLRNAGNLNIVGDGVSGVYAWGAQMELADHVGPYAKTTAAIATPAATVAEAATYDDNLSVYDAATDTLYTCVAASPGPLQFTYDGAGGYGFDVSAAGDTLEISYSANAGLATYQDYCWAVGFFISPLYNQPSAVSSLIEDIAKYTNSEIVWSAGALKFVPRGDRDATGNGHTFTAPAGTDADLTDDQFQVTGSGSSGSSGSPTDDPVLVTRRRVSDQKNVLQMEVLDRSNQYNAASIDATNQAAVDAFGRRPSGKEQAHLFADPSIGRISAQLLLQRQAILNTAAFTLDARFVWLDPMDIVSLTDANLGLDSSTWWRIIEISEQQDGSLNFLAEVFAVGMASADPYEYGIGTGYASNYNVDPGDVNTPIIFEPSVQLATNTGLEIWCAASGADPNWGGCDVYVSSDDVTYNLVGRKWGASRMGELTAPFPDHVDPDTVDTASVDLSESFSALLSATMDDADLGNTVSIVDAELFSYQSATLTSPYNYDLGTYLRRGQFGTASAAHLVGALFARLDDMIFALPYDKDQIGQTLYVKFVSFNLYGGGQQDISTVTAYPHTVLGPPVPGVVQNFFVIQQGTPVIFSWDDLPDFVLKGYDILYGDPSGTVDTATFLTQASRATEMTHANVPPGAWRFYIRGHDLADQVGPATSSDLTVINYNYQIAAQDNEADWFGTSTNYIRHASGVLVPQGQNLSNTYAWEVFDQYVPNPFPSPSYEGLELDSGAVGVMRVVLLMSVLPASAYGETGTPDRMGQIRTAPASHVFGAYADWLSGNVNAEYVQARFTGDTSVQHYVSMMDLLLDNPPITQTLSTVSIGVAGTVVAWPTAFRSPPNVQVTPAAAGATSGTAEAITATQALIKLWNGAVQVAGTANIAATGV